MADGDCRALQLETLRRMLSSVITERESLAASDPDMASHLADAAHDLRTLIQRLEDERDSTSRVNGSPETNPLPPMPTPALDGGQPAPDHGKFRGKG